MGEENVSPGSGTVGTSIMSGAINCIKQSINQCSIQRYGCSCAVSAPSWSVSMLFVCWNALVVIRIL